MDDFPSYYDLPEELQQAVEQLRHIDARILAAMALGCGWHMERSKGLHFVAPDGTTMTLPTNTGLNAKIFRSRLNTIVRHRQWNAPLQSVVEGIIAHPRLKIDPSRAQVLRTALEHAVPIPQPVEPAPSNGGSTEPAPVAARRKVRIVREEPWSAHRNAKGETYPSEAVMERTWSNDTVDFACRWEGCDFTDDSPRTVSSHYGPAHRHGEGVHPPAEIDGIDPTWVSNPRRTTRIRKLTREIDGAFAAAMSQGLALDPEWLAKWIIDHRIEALPGDTPVSDEPLSTEDILDKIAALVDRGRGKVLREQVDTLQHQVDDFMAERDTLRTEMTEQMAVVQARAERAENNLKAMRDMFNEAVDGE